MHPLQPAGFPNGAQKLAKLYQKRWTLEHLFQELGLVLHAESDTFFDLKAALLGFCGGLMSYNVLSVLKADLRAKDSACSPDPISPPARPRACRLHRLRGNCGARPELGHAEDRSNLQREAGRS